MKRAEWSVNHDEQQSDECLRSRQILSPSADAGRRKSAGSENCPASGKPPLLPDGAGRGGQADGGLGRGAATALREYSRQRSPRSAPGETVTPGTRPLTGLSEFGQKRFAHLPDVQRFAPLPGSLKLRRSQRLL